MVSCRKNDAVFPKKKKELGHPKCILDAKTCVLDENAEDLLDIHKYCMEDLNCDTHSYQFLKRARQFLVVIICTNLMIYLTKVLHMSTRIETNKRTI